MKIIVDRKRSNSSAAILSYGWGRTGADFMPNGSGLPYTVRKVPYTSSTLAEGFWTLMDEVKASE